jgi:hypothetical protein
VFLLFPKSCAKPWRKSGDRDLDFGGLTRVSLFIPSCPGLTGLDRCKALVKVVSGELPDLFVFGLRCC